jgi:hypothetical protein
LTTASGGFWRPGDSLSTNGHQIGYVDANGYRNCVTDDVITDSSQQIDLMVDGADPNIVVNTKGWYFPIGM